MRPSLIHAALLALVATGLAETPIRALAAGTALDGTGVVLAAGRRTQPPPIKDCTPWNGRSGFYGNIFCTEREQELWNRRGRRIVKS